MPTCPRCGRDDPIPSNFCRSCGCPLQSQQAPGQKVVYYSQKPNNGTTAILVVVLVVILVVGAAAATFLFYVPFGALSRVGSGPRPAQISSLFLAIIDQNNKSADYFGPAYRNISVYSSSSSPNGQVFQATFTLTLQGSMSRSVDSASLGFSPGFTLQSINPTLPHTVPVGSAVTFTVTLLGPNNGFSGSVTLDLFTH